MTFHKYEPPDDTPADLEREAPAEVEHARYQFAQDYDPATVQWWYQTRAEGGGA